MTDNQTHQAPPSCLVACSFGRAHHLTLAPGQLRGFHMSLACGPTYSASCYCRTSAGRSPQRVAVGLPSLRCQPASALARRAPRPRMKLIAAKDAGVLSLEFALAICDSALNCMHAASKLLRLRISGPCFPHALLDAIPWAGRRVCVDSPNVSACNAFRFPIHEPPLHYAPPPSPPPLLLLRGTCPLCGSRVPCGGTSGTSGSAGPLWMGVRAGSWW